MGVLACTAIMLHLTACRGQATDGTTASMDSTAYGADTPQVEVRVNKQYDANGNLIAYDSTYSSVYSSRAGDAAFMDSVFKDFMPGFGSHYPFLSDPGLNSLFFPDSSFHRDFFHDDFFQKRMEMNQRAMQRMMERMDSLKNQYFRQGGWPREQGTPGGPSGSSDQGAPQQLPSPRPGADTGSNRSESVEL